MPNTYLSPTVVLPKSLLISAITKSSPMVITVGSSNNYVVGQLVSLTVPSTYGMYQANQLIGQITAINGLDFSVDIDSTQFDTFSVPPTYQERPASLSPYGSRNLYNVQYVPFHSQNNIGN